MIQISSEVFEINHPVTIAPLSYFDRWKKGEVYFNDCWILRTNSQWLTKEEVIENIICCDYPPKENPYDMDSATLDNFLSDKYDIYTYDNYFNDDNYDYYVEDYRTEHGNDIVAFSRYGY